MEARDELTYRKSLFSVKKQDGRMGRERVVGRESKPTTPEGHLGKLEDPILFFFFFFSFVKLHLAFISNLVSLTEKEDDFKTKRKPF